MTIPRTFGCTLLMALLLGGGASSARAQRAQVPVKTLAHDGRAAGYYEIGKRKRKKAALRAALKGKGLTLVPQVGSP